MYIISECRTTKAALEEREKLLMTWLRVALGKGGIAGGNEVEQEEEEEEVGPSDAFSSDEIVEFVSEEEYLQDKGTVRVCECVFYADK